MKNNNINNNATRVQLLLKIKLERIGIMTSFIIGLPVGLLTIALTLILPTVISGDGLPTMGLIAVYGKAIVGLIAAFIFSLWYAGKRIAHNIEQGDSLLRTSFKYSLTVNKIIWSVFLILTIVQNIGIMTFLFLIPPIIAFFVSVGCTTLTLGLLISWIVEQRVTKTRNLIVFV